MICFLDFRSEKSADGVFAVLTDKPFRRLSWFGNDTDPAVFKVVAENLAFADIVDYSENRFSDFRDKIAGPFSYRKFTEAFQVGSDIDISTGTR